MIGAFLGLAAMIAAILVPIMLLRGNRKAYLSTLGKDAVTGLTQATASLWDAPPQWQVLDAGKAGMIEGRRRGEAIDIKDKLANFVEQRFDGDMSSALLDDETKQAIIDYAVMVPMLERIEVTEQGLSITWGGGPNQKTAVANDQYAQDVARTVALAERLQKRILGTLEQRVAEEAHVRVDAYREAGPSEPLDAEEEEAREERA